MPPTNVVVDGSNIATEGRSTPSLEQLDQAVRQYLEENPDAQVTVVVDASFGHRIDPKERAAFEEAVSHGELVSPPAGAIGRGDAFLLRIAERTGARVLSNDSFREFHAEHPWLFDEDRLVGGTPVPGVGWIFSPRRPVRATATSDQGGKSRRTKAVSIGPKGEEKGDKKPERKKRKPPETASGVRDAIAQATQEALGPEEKAQKKGSRKQRKDAAPEAVNDPLPFITFVTEHPVGSRFDGTVVSFTSHGAMAQVGDLLCYVPLAGLGVPPPRRARDVLVLGESRTFELVALDPSRRGAQLALPEVVASTGLIAEGAEEAASEVRSKRKKTPQESSRPSRSSRTGISEPIKPTGKADASRKKADGAAGTKAAKAGKVPNVAKATKATKATGAVKTEKAPASSKALKTTKTTKAPKATKAAKTTKATKATKKSGKTEKASRALKATPSRSPAAAKVAKAAKSAKASKKAGSSDSSTPRKVVKSG
jgi:Zc3h12a-like Ribonuclease NYN domain